MKYEVYRFRELTKKEIEKEQKKEDKAQRKNEEYIVKEQIREKIQNIVTFNWSDNKDNKFLSFDFTTNQKLSVNDWIELYSYTDRRTVFFGKITDISIDNNGFKYSGYDYAYFILNLNTTIQYNNASIQEAIVQLCSKKELNLGTIDFQTGNTLEKIYRNVTINDVLNDIYERALKTNVLEDKYYINSKDRNLNFHEYTEVDRIQGYTGGRYKINSFEYVISVDGRTWNRKEQIEFQDGSTLKVFADYKLQTGIYTHIRNDVLKMNGYYLVTSSKHSIKGGLEEVEVTLVKYNPFKQEPESTKQEEIPPKKETEDL